MGQKLHQLPGFSTNSADGFTTYTDGTSSLVVDDSERPDLRSAIGITKAGEMLCKGTDYRR
ncbi:MAG: hypothetical protein EBE86_031855 [Hormoscilla sp. GUM202]|nr:hypothetical protein [Hormoscilla sp. GUM202]